MQIKPLKWREPTDHPQDDKSAVVVADGIGGRYSIVREGTEFLLWYAGDEFTWATFMTIDQAKRNAQSDFATKMLTLIDH